MESGIKSTEITESPPRVLAEAECGENGRNKEGGKERGFGKSPFIYFSPPGGENFWEKNFRSTCDEQSKERRRDRVSTQEGR